jgi:SAM-dependent methyltransferase
LEQIAAWAGEEPDSRFFELEFGPGLGYYRDRLARLSLSGSRVLDAGCGMGQWSAALSYAFDRVDALDPNATRLAVAAEVCRHLGRDNVFPSEASVENLPFPDETFDAVFCYGVIMFTDAARTLKELARVLRPGGRGYVCLNGDGFSQYLAEERGDEAGATAGWETLYNTYWRRALEAGLAEAVRGAVGFWVSPFRGRRSSPEKRAGRALRSRAPRAWVESIVRSGEPGSRLMDEVNTLPERYYRRMIAEVRDLLANDALPTPRTRAMNHLPDEFRALVESAGLDGFAWSEEGRLVCDWTRPEREPKYPGTFAGLPAVWECLFSRPGSATRAVSPSFHIERARDARRRALFVCSGPDPVLSNASREASPPAMMEEAAALARALGERDYLGRLAEQLAGGASDPEEVVERLVVFVQQALYRDPVVQPRQADGGLPDALTILCCARGRCGHASRLLVALARAVDLEARAAQLRGHVVAEIRAGDRWVVAEADAFKHGVVPRDREGRLPTMESLREDPYVLDRHPLTGWTVLPGSAATCDALGVPVRGYVDALEPSERGFLSGYFVPEAEGWPPSRPGAATLERHGTEAILRWEPSTVRTGRIAGYRVRVGIASRGWSYATARPGDSIVEPLPGDVAAVETTSCDVTFDAPSSGPLFASVTAFSDRVEVEPETWFWPSEEASLVE